MNDSGESVDWQKAAIQYLSSLRMAGITELPGSNESILGQIRIAVARTEEVIGQTGGMETEKTVNSEDENPESTLREADPDQDESPESRLKVLAESVQECRLCRELVAHRTQTVFGVGNPRARLCFMGEAPGAEEDQQGEPFVGPAGQLLDRIINACKMQREDVYILNTIKCRPPGNRNPQLDECENCRPYLDRQLDIIRPEFICCLGGIAAKNLLNTEQSVGKLRGRLHLYRGIKVVVTYHPAYLLRQPQAKRQVWDDMQFLMAEMGHDIS